MKFIVQASDKAGKSGRIVNNADKKKELNNCYYNILNPSNKIQCDVCKRDITRCTKVLADDCDYCVGCFANLEDMPATYHVINKLDFPLFESEWTADEELLLFEGLEKHGFRNWGEIADFIGTNKTREEVEEHYQSLFVDNGDVLQTLNVITRRDSTGRLSTKAPKEAPERKKLLKVSNRGEGNTNHQSERRALTLHNSSTANLKNSTSSNPAQIVGYMPKRGDFEVQYDNDAQLLLAEMQFNDDDSEEEKRMKFRLIDIYNYKLSERIRRKQFVISRRLLDVKEQTRLDKTRTKEEKEIYNMMKVFARFNTPDEHEKLVNGIIKEKQIRQRIEELKELRAKGYRNLAELEAELQNKKRKDEKGKRKEDPLINFNDKSKTRHSRKNLLIDKNQKRNVYLSQEEEELCQNLNMTYRQYMMAKETIIRESVKQGFLSKDEVSKLFKIERVVADGIFDYLVEKEDIIEKTYTEDSK